jgi:hypothetical protein
MHLKDRVKKGWKCLSPHEDGSFVVAVTHFAQTDDAGHVLQFAIAVGEQVRNRAGDRNVVPSRRVASANLLVCVHRMPACERRARCDIAATALDLDKTQPA